MSNGDEQEPDAPDEGPSGDEETGAEEADEPEAEGDAAGEEELPAESLEARLRDAESALEDAETEADLDEVESTLDELGAAIEAADFPEPDEEDGESPGEALESGLDDLRERLEEARGPYPEDVIESLDEAATTLTDTRWTDRGATEISTAVTDFLDEAGEALDAEFAAESDDTGALAAALSDVSDAIEATGLDADGDAETIGALVEAAEALGAGLDDAEEWDDLTVREKLDEQGFYDVLTAENRKDFPPEWGAVKIYERRYAETGDAEAAEYILMALDLMDADFMEENCFESLKRIGPPEAVDPMLELAEKRNKAAIEVLGTIGDDDAIDALVDLLDPESGDLDLQRVTLRAVGEIGSQWATQAVANMLASEHEELRSGAARALGMIGDTRAIDPLADVLADDDADTVRASAAWALNQIGTGRALDVVGEYDDDRAYLVQAEAEKAV